MRAIKIILATVCVCIATGALVLNLFLTTILGTFGLAMTSVDKLQQMRQSQRVVDKMKARHADKKSALAKRHSKRAGKRIASTALAAATIGTVAVAVTMATIEVDDYCDEQRVLQDDANILYGTEVEFDLGQCVDQGLQDSAGLLSEVKHSAGQAVAEALESSAVYSAEAWQAVKQQGVDALQLAGDVAASLWDAMRNSLVGEAG